MKRTLITLLPIFALLMLLAVPAFAQDDPDDGDDPMGFVPGNDDAPFMMFRGGGAGGGMGMMRMMDDLDLSKDQRKQISDLGFSFRKEVIPMRAQMQVMRLDLAQLMQSDASQSDINKKLDQIGNLRTEIAKKAVAHRIAVKKVLTPEQLDKLQSRPRMMGKGPRQQIEGKMNNRPMRRGAGRGL